MSNREIDLDIAYHVNCQDFHGAELCDDSPRFYAAAAWVAERFRLNRLFVSIAIVDDATIQDQNRELMQHDWPTDVLSLLLDRRAAEVAGEWIVEGEIIAGIETAARLCTRAGWSTADELLLYVVHGLLHIAGLDDRTPEQAERMRSMEVECLRALKVDGADEHGRRFNEIFCEDESSE